jgi:uncharacterized protein YbbC (DUF1343 family)/CubicO group peptidase (beta-lactamase class C family)
MDNRVMNPALLAVGLAMVLSASAVAADVPRVPRARPDDVGMDAGQLDQIDDVVAKGIADGEMPGCVVLIARGGKIAFLKAYGHRQVEPAKAPMKTDTVFDLASITKPLATATSVMILVGQGKVRLHDRVSKHIPEFGQNGKKDITVYELLTHQGGLTPDNSIRDYANGAKKAWERIFALGLREPPGTKFIYTDVGYLVLAEMVRRVSGKGIDAFTRDNIYQPLGMADTGYLPDAKRRSRAAPTGRRGGKWIQGEVHDPRARALGGVAGHAGVFSTAEDLAVYGQMLLGRGRYADVRVLEKEIVARMSKGYPVAAGLRGLGWDVRTGYSSNRGDSFSPRAFGHGGFTGTTFWVDPGLDLNVIFLSSRLHPDGVGAVNRLAGRIGDIAAKAIRPEATDRPDVLPGIDVLVRDGFKQLKGRRVGLITNHTGVDRKGKTTAQLLHEAPNVKLVALFSPEHGLEGTLDRSGIPDTKDARLGVTVYSLYNKTRRPAPESLQGLDTLVFDIQDIGTRYYTYISTMGYCMEAAAKAKLRFVVLDRPNPINGVDVAGPMLDVGRESFTGYYRLPVRHGMTVGELARMFNTQLKLKLKLEVIAVAGWRRTDFHDELGLTWINPSPNMRSQTEAILYPGIGLLETTNLSVGRGTATPFEVIGAPWLDGVRLVERLDALKLPGVRFQSIVFAPTASKYAGERCGGMSIAITDRATFRPGRTGLEIARQLRILFPKDWKVVMYDRLLRNRATLDAVTAGESVDRMESLNRDALGEFLALRRRFLLYKEDE